ncbi:MAG: hypothetical protein RLZZ501_2745, partial [Pseudomonadota bacterium]
RHRRFLSAAAGYRLSDLRPAAGGARPAAMAAQLLGLVELASGRPVGPLAPLPADPVRAAEAERLLPPGRG